MKHLVLLLLVAFQWANVQSLVKTDVLPCSLESAYILRCSGPQITNEVLKTVGPKISSATVIDIFSISNTSLTEIGANTFPNSDFKNIEIEHNAKLVKLDPKAFRSPAAQVVSSLQFNNNKMFSDNTIYELTRNLRLSDSIHLNSNALTEIPSHAFAANVTSKRDLQLITVTDNKITRIHSDAFNGVPELTRINLLGNKINLIDENGLRFDVLDYGRLQVNLAYNELSEKSLVQNSFAIPNNTAISVLMEANQFTTLDEAVFKHLIDNGKASEFYFASSKFNCGCDMKWLLELKDAKKHFGDIFCVNSDNNSIYTLNVTDLKC